MGFKGKESKTNNGRQEIKWLIDYDWAKESKKICIKYLNIYLNSNSKTEVFEEHI